MTGRGVEQDLKWAEESPDHHIIPYYDWRYPFLLKEISSFPPILFLKGEKSLLLDPQLAMVGSRHPSVNGTNLAFKFARYFSEKNFSITSGLAIGIDGASHRGALHAGGKTLAVLGCGLDQIYPNSHRALADEIVEKGGAWVSEFPIGTPPKPFHFPRRNRIISGLSLGTVVVEASLKSGSLITAGFAADQGREVFALPGPLDSPLAKGCHALIREGAKLVESPEDVLEELGGLHKFVRAEAGLRERREGEEVPSLPERSLQLLSQIGYGVTPVEVIVHRSKLTVAEVSSMLLKLELGGFVATVPGGYARILG